jgi:CHAT domain-containing protein
VLPGVIAFDDEFTADALRAALTGRYAVVHIASHFVFRAGRERDSWLLLGDGSRLNVEEILALPFDGVELVALSACETAIGAGRRDMGREVEGLAAMLIALGARSVLASLWFADDSSTAVLMRHFYDGWCRGMAPAAALRAALASSEGHRRCRRHEALPWSDGLFPRNGRPRTLISGRRFNCWHSLPDWCIMKAEFKSARGRSG